MIDNENLCDVYPFDDFRFQEDIKPYICNDNHFPKFHFDLLYPYANVKFNDNNEGKSNLDYQKSFHDVDNGTFYDEVSKKFLI